MAEALTAERIAAIIDERVAPLAAENAQLREDSKKREREVSELQVDLEQQKRKNDALVAEFLKVKSSALPQCQELTGLGTSSSQIRERFQFAKEIRMLAEASNSLILTYDDDSLEGQTLRGHMTKMIRMLDLRLASFHAAGAATTTHKKAEFVCDYYTQMRSKIDKTAGKWATGEKSLSEVDYDVKTAIEDKYAKEAERAVKSREAPRGRGNGRNYAGGAAGGNGFGGGGGRRGGRGHRGAQEANAGGGN